MRVPSPNNYINSVSDESGVHMNMNSKAQTATDSYKFQSPSVKDNRSGISLSDYHLLLFI